MEFNAKEQLPGLIDWMRTQMAACGGKTAVVGISGGKDSSVTAALCVRAYGRENVLGVLMPDGVQPDIDYSNGLVDVLGLRHITFNIHGGTAGILEEMERVGMTPSRQTKVNLPSRMRMATLYAVGLPYMGLILNVYLGKGWSLGRLLRDGMLLFLPGDALKIAVAAILFPKLSVFFDKKQ